MQQSESAEKILENNQKFLVIFKKAQPNYKRKSDKDIDMSNKLIIELVKQLISFGGILLTLIFGLLAFSNFGKSSDKRLIIAAILSLIFSIIFGVVQLYMESIFFKESGILRNKISNDMSQLIADISTNMDKDNTKQIKTVTTNIESEENSKNKNSNLIAFVLQLMLLFLAIAGICLIMVAILFVN